MGRIPIQQPMQTTCMDCSYYMYITIFATQHITASNQYWNTTGFPRPTVTIYCASCSVPLLSIKTFPSSFITPKWWRLEEPASMACLF